jgi:hypothetical protein
LRYWTPLCTLLIDNKEGSFVLQRWNFSVPINKKRNMTLFIGGNPKIVAGGVSGVSGVTLVIRTSGYKNIFGRDK